MKLSDIADDGAFHAFMLEVNARLQLERVPIVERPHRALAVLSERVRERLNWFDGPEVRRIATWYTIQYGARAQAGLWTHRRLLALLGGDPWELRVPMFYGRVKLDLGRMIEKGTPALMSRIAAQELKALDAILPDALNALNALNRASPKYLGDWFGAVEHATSAIPDFGLSRWSSQQALEKILKDFIAQQGASYPFTHNLQTLVELAEGHGLQGMDRALLSKVECRPPARYAGDPENVSSTAAQAVEAHQASVILSGRIIVASQGTQWPVEVHTTLRADKVE